MAFTDNDHVLTCSGTIIWEAVTKPDVNEKSGNQSWNLRVAVDPNAPEVAELRQLIDKALRESPKPGVTVQRPGNNPIGQIDPTKFPELPGTYLVFSAGTIQGAPPVFDINGKQLESIAYGPQLYNGAVVRLLVHAYAYDNVQKGINFGLDGVQIIDSKAPRLSIGAAGMAVSAVAAAFGGSAPAPAVQPQTPPPAPGAAPAAPPAPNTGYMEPPAPPAAPQFPPEGWLAHPSAPGYFYRGQEVLTEADLRARG